MPFTSELNDYYPYLNLRLEREHGLACHRADERWSTKPVRDKINDDIGRADPLIADRTGSNPNVLCEIGLAHALGKDLILITQDSMSQVPSDLLLYEFLKYDLARHHEFLLTRDAAIQELLVLRCDRMFDAATALLDEYRRSHDATAQPVAKFEFLTFIKVAERSGRLPRIEARRASAEVVLPVIVAGGQTPAVMSSITAWLVTLD